MTNDNEDRLILRTTYIDNQDVKAEASLIELETNNKPSLRIIRNKLQNQEGRIFYYGSYHRSLDTLKPPWSDDRSDQLQVVNRITNWALEQSPHIQDVVFSFLDGNNKEELLPQVIRDLGLSAADNDQSPVTKPKKKFMSDIMRDSLPATKEELILLIQSVSPETKRPASTVRQFLRTETRAERIYLAVDERYYHS